jgi:uncharacterized protein (TIGR03643 family)
MAWEDRTSFEQIKKKAGLSEGEVIKLMRKNLKPTSFRRWRERVTGRSTKHEKRFKESRQIKCGRLHSETLTREELA